MKKLVFFCMLWACSCGSLLAQNEANSGWEEFSDTINYNFEPLDLSGATTGFLLNKSVGLSNLEDYDGTNLILPNNKNTPTNC